MGNRVARAEPEQVSESDEDDDAKRQARFAVFGDGESSDEEPKATNVTLGSGDEKSQKAAVKLESNEKPKKTEVKVEVPAKKEKREPVARIDPAAVALLAKAKAAAKAKSKSEAKAKEAAPAPATGVAAPAAAAPEGAAPETPAEDLLPRGGEGCVWEALRPCIVRAERDPKAERTGAVQEGECFVQTGPWRADPSGRVRMPIKAPRGVTGWITLDERRCMMGSGDFGETYAKLTDRKESMQEPEPKAKAVSTAKRYLSKVEKKEKPPAAPIKVEEAKAVDEDDEDEDVPQSSAPVAQPVVEEDDGFWEERPVAKAAPAKRAIAKRAPAQPAPAQPAPEACPESKAELSEAAKALRNCRKKLQAAVELETKAASATLSAPEKEKLGKIAALRRQEAELVEAVRIEEGKAKEKEKKKKPRKKAAGAKASEAKSGSNSLITQAAFVAIIAVAGASAWLYLWQ